MPHKPARPCRRSPSGCPELTNHASGFCVYHRAAYHAELDARRPRAAERGYDSTWRVVRAEHLAREPRCRMADGTCAGPLHVDHIVPLSAGGTHDPSNLRTLCASHHNARTARDQAFGRGASPSSGAPA